MHTKIIAFILFFLFLSPASGTVPHSEFNNKTIDENLNATSAPDHIVLTWSDDPSTTQTITWRALSSVTEGYVRYYESEKPESGGIVKKAGVDLFTTVSGDTPGSMNIFSVTLTGLKPGTRYLYRVICGETSSRHYSFSTAQNTVHDFEFLIFGDSQSGNAKNPDYSKWHTTANNAFQRHQEAKFIINMGDLVETGQSYIHWNNWFDAARDIISMIPIVPIEGNHETLGPIRLSVMIPKYFVSQFKVLQNGPDGLKGRVYSFDYGDVHFSILDSQPNEGSFKNGESLNAQTKWLENDLRAAKKKWKFVLFHKTPYSHHPLRTNSEVKKAFCPIIDKYHADVVFNGHDHVIARSDPMKNNAPCKDTKEGTVYYTTGRSGALYNSLIFSLPGDAFFYNPADEPCYVSVKVNNGAVRILAYKQNGSIIDSYTLEK